MIFDFKSDFRISPVIRDSSWMGAETVPESITGVVTITSGGVLTLTDNVVLPDVHIESGGKLIVEPTAHPVIAGTLTVEADGVLHIRPGGSLTNGTQMYLGTTFEVSKDTYLDENDDTGHGTFPVLYAWGISGGQSPAGPDPPSPSRRVGLMQWNVSTIPVGSVAQNARLILDVTNETSSPGYDFFELLRDWNESQASWTNASSGNPWQSPGASGSQDRELFTPMGNAILSKTGTVQFDLGTHGAEVVTTWIQSAPSNHGLAVARTINSDALEWSSKDQPSANSAPTLEVTYTVGRQLDVKTFLEGPYFNQHMATTLHNFGVIPLNQPYNVDPWFYAGSESVAAVPSGTVDWVLVHLLTDATEPQIVARKAGLLDEFGNVSVLFTGVPSGQYRVAVDHRNHIGVMSASAVDLTGSSATFDFTVPGAAEAEGTTPMKDKSGVKVMFAADGEVDGQITAPDFNIWNAETTAGATGYRTSDYNMDRIVTAPDFNLWNPNTTAGAQMPKALVCALYGKGCQSGQAEALATVEAYVRLNVAKDNGNAFWVDVEIRRDPGLTTENLGSAVVDLYYSNSELSYSTSLPGDLGGLLTSTKFYSDNDGAYVRYQVRASGPIPVVPVGTDWELLVQHRFTRTPPPRPENASIRDVSLHLGFVENFQARIIRSVNVQVDGTVGKSDISEATSEEIPLEFSMGQNYPNPFNPVTRVSFALPEKAHVRLAVFDMLGRTVRLQLDDEMKAGVHATTVDASDLPSGVYFLSMQAGDYRETRKMTVMR